MKKLIDLISDKVGLYVGEIYEEQEYDNDQWKDVYNLAMDPEEGHIWNVKIFKNEDKVIVKTQTGSWDNNDTEPKLETYTKQELVDMLEKDEYILFTYFDSEYEEQHCYECGEHNDDCECEEEED